MKYFLGIIIAVLLSSCEPNMVPSKVPQQLSTDTTKIEAIETINLTDTASAIRIDINGLGVKITSANVNTVYATDVNNIRLVRNEQGNVEYFQVNEVVLFKQKRNINHVYHYLDHNFIEVVKGNTIDGIIADHPEYKLTRVNLYKCNPILKQRGLQIGDRIKLDCDN